MPRTKYLTIFIALFFSIQVSHAEMTPLGENTYHFFKDFYGSLVVIGDKGVAVVDPASTDRAKAMQKEIAKLTDKKVSHVILTHEHYDHAGGSEVFTDAEIVCHNSCQKFFDLDVFGKTPKKVTLSFEDNLNIDLGSHTLELHHWGSADGVATTVIYVPEAKVAASADIYEGPKVLTPTIWLEDKNLLGNRLVLNKMAQWDLKHSLAGHSDNTDPEVLREHAKFNNDLYALVKKALDEIIAQDGVDAAFEALGGELPETLQLPAYSEWEGYEDDFAKHVWRMGMSIMHGG